MTSKENISSSVYPRQKLSRSKKTDKWGRECVDWIIRTATTTTISDKVEMKANYDLYNNKIDSDDFKYVTDPYGLDKEFPARLQNFNIITPKLELLAGEEIKRPFNFRVAAVNSEAVSRLQEKRKELLLQYLESEILYDLQMSGVNIQDPATGDVMTPPEIEKYLQYSDSDIRESTANKISNYLIKKENLEFKFNKGFKDALIADTEIYYIGIDGDEPICEVVNPLDFDYDKDPDLDYIQDGQWARHTKYMTINQVLDTYYKDLKESDIDRLESENYMGTSGNTADSSINRQPHINMHHDEFSLNYITVTRVEWKSMRKIGFLKYYDENYEEQEIIVDEDYQPDVEAGEEIEWEWITEVWEGTKIGNDIYVRIKPKRVQYRTMDNPSIAKLGYVGTVYHNRNSKSISLLGLVKHHQYLYNVIMYRLEMEIAKAKGKKMVMDIAQIPKSHGMDLEKWMYYLESMNIAFINSFEEGSGKFQGTRPDFNQFQALDMTLSQSVGQYIGILSKIEEQVESLMGISRQRQGAISSNETVGGVERAVVQSSHITEPLFYKHNEVKKHVLTQLIESAKVVYPVNKKINYILDDMSRVMLEVNEEFIDADYGVFVTNSSKEVKALEDLRAMAQQAAASGLMTLTDLITIFDSNSMADIKSVVQRSEQRAQEQAEAESQAQMEQIELQHQAEMERIEYDHNRLDEREYIKGELALQREEIRAMGFASDTDVNNNNVPDILEIEKLRNQNQEHLDKIKLEKEKLKIEREKIKSNESIAKEKAITDRIKAKKSNSNNGKK